MPDPCVIGTCVAVAKRACRFASRSRLVTGCALLAWAVLALAPAIGTDEAEGPDAVAKIVGEASRLAGEARQGYAEAKGKPPSLERNERLSEVRQRTKQALEQYQLAAAVAPERAKAFEEEMRDLRGMLFWCNKSFIVLVPKAPEKPPEVPSPAPPPVPEAPAPSPAPSPVPPDEPPAPRPDLVKRCGDLSDHFKGLESRRDRLARTEERIPSILAALDDLHASLASSGGNWAYVKRCAQRRGALLEELKRCRASLEEGARQLHEQEARLLECRASLEWSRRELPPSLTAWCWKQPAESLPEGMVAYVNRMLGPDPAFSVTPVPEGEKAPRAEEIPVAEARPVLELLDALAESYIRQAEGQGRIRRREAEAVELGRESEFAQAWLNRPGAHAVSEWEQTRKLREGLGVQKARLEKEAVQLRTKQSFLAEKLEGLRSRLAEVPPNRVRLVESWRRRGKNVPPELHEALEAWTLRALGIDPGGR